MARRLDRDTLHAMRIHFARADGSNGRPLDVARQWFGTSPFFCESAESADVVLILCEGYVSNQQWRRNSRRFPGKPCLLYSEADQPNLALRGLFPSAYRAMGGRDPFPFLIQSHPTPSSSQLLDVTARTHRASFKGRCETHRVRSALRQALPASVIDTGIQAAAAGEPLPAAGHHCAYCQLMHDTVFSLCPRGFGASTYRLYESMAWGCVPVILSDAFMEPSPEIEWSRFAVRIRERDVHGIDSILREYEPQAQTMSRLARAAWEEHFSPGAIASGLPKLVSELLRHAEIDRVESMRNKMERFHLGAFLRERVGR